MSSRICEALQTAFASAKLPKARISLRVESLLALYAAVVQSNAVGLLPRCVESSGLFGQNIRYLDIEDLISIDFYAVFRRRGVHLSEPGQYLIDRLVAQAAVFRSKDNNRHEQTRSVKKPAALRPIR